MPKIAYVNKKLGAPVLATIKSANDIIAEYSAQGFDLTLRQLYYQFVARGLLPNTMQSYKRLGDIINDGRLTGHIDWNTIVDRTRAVDVPSVWESPESIVAAVADQFRIDKWETQPYHVEVWVEKEALAGVFERICDELYLPHLSCRGYVSQSEMWRAAQRLKKWERAQATLILHFGDHDPSGIDMTRDIQDRLALFGSRAEVKRIALTMEQVEQYNPPPNPAKSTDARFQGYVDIYGDESWELDALDPTVLADLVRAEVNEVIDKDEWEKMVAEEDDHRETLNAISARYDEVKELVS